MLIHKIMRELEVLPLIIGGLQKLTLLDFPGSVACTVFLQGCNFRCPFCHNTPLVTGHTAAAITEEELLTFLKKRQGLLDGVALTGGEPLLQPELESLIVKIRALGYRIKLDTNGGFPQHLERLLGKGLLDYVAMDIKNAPDKYERTAGARGILPAVKESAKLLLEGTLPFEFRTTVVNELHEPSDFTAIGEWLGGSEAYFLQGFVDSGNVLGGLLHAASPEKMQACLQAAQVNIPRAQIRGE